MPCPERIVSLVCLNRETWRVCLFKAHAHVFKTCCCVLMYVFIPIYIYTRKWVFHVSIQAAYTRLF